MTDAEDYIEKFTIEFAKKEFDVDVKVEFMNTISLWGQHNTGKNLIRYSKAFIELNKDNKEVLDDLAIHGCCHIQHRNHGRIFKNLCQSYGLVSNHTARRKDVKVPEPKKYYLYRCDCCGGEEKSIRYINKKGACSNCCNKYNNGRYDEKYRFKLVRYVDETKENKNVGDKDNK